MKPPPTILLVEDDPRDAEFTLSALASIRPCPEVIHVCDGAEALDFLYRRGAYAARETRRPAVILLDLKMPRIDGMEVLRQVKADPELRMLPVVILTSSREERDVRDAYALGANAYVVKPVRFQSFLDAIKSLGSFWTELNEPPPVADPGTCG
jgi:CheY-like chemotaxis protein